MHWVTELHLGSELLTMGMHTRKPTLESLWRLLTIEEQTLILATVNGCVWIKLIEWNDGIDTVYYSAPISTQDLPPVNFSVAETDGGGKNGGGKTIRWVEVEPKYRGSEGRPRKGRAKRKPQTSGAQHTPFKNP